MVKTHTTKPVAFRVLITLAIALSSCANNEKEVEVDQKEVKGYILKKYQYSAIVGGNYYRYHIWKDKELLTKYATQYGSDSCVIYYPKSRDWLLFFNVCDNSINEKRPKKNSIDINQVDSILIYSHEFKSFKRLSNQLENQFVKDWNKSSLSDYRHKDFDNMFYPTYHYKILVFLSEETLEFRTGTFLIGDKSKWTYYITDDTDKEYFNRIWNGSK